MTELYPLLGGRDGVRGVIGSGGDATKVCTINECRYYLWMNRLEAWNVTSYISRGALVLEGEKGKGFAPIRSWTTSPPYVHARTVSEVDEYARWLHRQVGNALRGKTVLLGFSGGKDSVATLLILLALRERIGFRLRVMYVYMPYIESPRNIEFVEKVSSKLDVNIEIVEAARRTLKTMLKWRGMPRRGYRFCTAYKAIPMKKARRSDESIIEVVGDRLTESPKRLKRLSKAAAYRVILVGRTFRPTYILTLADVVNITRRSGLIHPDYLKGLPRVACTLCPFKTLYEFNNLDPLEDNELIDRVLHKMWSKWYTWTSYNVFREQHLWRFSAIAAKPLLYAKQLLAHKGAEGAVSARSVAEAYRQVWLQGIDAPLLSDPWQAAEITLSAMKNPGKTIVTPAEK